MIVSTHKWDKRFLEQALKIAEWSKDPSTKVGCVVVNPESRSILCTGYNGLPRGIKDTTERLTDRNFKYHVTAHAEINAICNAARDGVSINGATVFSTWIPCCGHKDGLFPSCSSALIQVGIKRVVVPAMEIPERWKESFELSKELFEEAGVAFVTVDMDDTQCEEVTS
jgi:dCMP deaminase